MKTVISVLAFLLLLGFIPSSFAVTVTREPKQGITIKTELYELFWREDNGSHGMGYTDVTFEEAGKLMVGGELYHDLDYQGGRTHWGAMIDDETEILQEDPYIAVVKYVSHDAKTLEYTCIATYWELLPYFKHEVTVTNDGAEGAAWPITGYDPLLIPGGDIEWDEDNKVGNMASSKEPIPHIVYWNDKGFGGLYASTPKARPRFGDWHGEGTMIRLDHGLVATQVERKTTSPPLVYYLGFGVGGEAEAHALATQIMELPQGKAVEPAGKLSTTWSAIKTSY